MYVVWTLAGGDKAVWVYVSCYCTFC